MAGPWEAYQESKPAGGPWDTATSDYTPAHDGEPAKITVRPKKEDTFAGRAQALGVGAIQGVTGNLADELQGAHAAGIPDGPVEREGPGSVLSGLAQLAYEHATGKPGPATKAYEAARDKWRGTVKQSEEDYPGTTLAGNLLGGAVAPVGRALQAGTVTARAGRSAMVGAGMGGVSGYGEGEGAADSAVKAGTGTAIGGVVGGAVAPAVEGGLQVGRYLTNGVRRGVENAFNPDAGAARMVANTMGVDARADPGAVQRLTPREFIDNAQGGGPARNIDMGGGATRGLADWASTVSPAASTILNRSINTRFESQGPRIVAWLNDTFHYPNALAQEQALQTAQRTVNVQRYNRAFETHDGPMWDRALGELAADPIVQSAIRRAQATVQTSRHRAGYMPMNTPFEFEASSGRLTQRRDPNGNPTYPDLRFWDEVKKQLDKGDQNARQFARVLRNHLDELTIGPNGTSLYAQARQGHAFFAGAEDALEAGQNFVASKLDNDRARQELARMNPTERQLFQDGFVGRFMEMLGEVKDRRNVLNNINASPAARERLGIALGQQRANEFEALLRVEGVMDLPRGVVQGNSWTAKRLYQMGQMGGTGIGATGTYDMDPQQAVTGAVIAAIATGGKRVDERVAVRVAQLLVSNDPRQLILGVRLIARNNHMMDNLRATDVALARLGAQQAPRPGAQSLMQAGADENSPEAPRPTAQ